MDVEEAAQVLMEEGEELQHLERQMEQDIEEDAMQVERDALEEAAREMSVAMELAELYTVGGF